MDGMCIIQFIKIGERTNVETKILNQKRES